MQRVQPGHEVLSLFGLAPTNNKALPQAIASHKTAWRLTGAFFIVVVVSLMLNVVMNMAGTPASTASAPVIDNALEVSAYQPGQFVSSKISQGYLGTKH